RLLGGLPPAEKGIHRRHRRTDATRRPCRPRCARRGRATARWPLAGRVVRVRRGLAAGPGDVAGQRRRASSRAAVHGGAPAIGSQQPSVGLNRLRESPAPRLVSSVQALHGGILVGMSTRLLTADDWRQLRALRLTALKDSPGAFLSTYEEQRDWTEPDWRTEAPRGACPRGGA